MIRFLARTMKSPLPSELRSVGRIEVAPPEESSIPWSWAKVPSPVPPMTRTLLERLLATARSCLPSPSKSATTIATGSSPAMSLEAYSNVPSPFPSDTKIVSLGKGDGTFEYASRLIAGDDPVAMVVADFDGDGRQDLAVANNLSSSVLVIGGTGDGTFAQDHGIELSYGGATSILPTDLNSDGRDDFIVLAQNLIIPYVNLGGRSFQFGDVYSIYNGHTITGIGMDLNQDDRTDIAVVSEATDNVYVFLGHGDGALVSGQLPSLITGDGPSSVASGDFNSDGTIDLAVANGGLTTAQRSNDISVFLGHGDATFEGQARYPAGIGPVSLAAGDFNLDGRDDLVTANMFSDDISVLLGNGDGTFQFQSRIACGARPRFLVVGDWNADGRLDLAVADFAADDVAIFIGDGTGGFSIPSHVAVGDGPAWVAVGDLNNDGRQDLAVANLNSADVSVLLGQGDGTFVSGGRFAAGAQ